MVGLVESGWLAGSERRWEGMRGVRRRESSWRVAEGQVERVMEDSWGVEVGGRDVSLLYD